MPSGSKRIFSTYSFSGIAAETVDDFAEQFEIDIAVDEFGFGRIGGLIGEGAMDAGFVAGPGGIEIEIGRQAGIVRHEVADGDGALAALKFGKVFGDRVVGREAAFVVELHQRAGGGDDFGERGDVEDGVGGHRLARGQEGAFAVGFAIDDFAVVADRAGRRREVCLRGWPG